MMLDSKDVKQTRVIFKTISVLHLLKGEYQPRHEFDSIKLAELAESIKEVGILSPILVRPTINNNYEIIAGERRWRAAKMVGLMEVPCIISPEPDDQALIKGLIENIARENLNPIEEAEGMARLIEEFNFGQDKIAQMFGKSISEISNSLRLLKLDKGVQTLIISGDLSKTHGRLIAGISNKEKQYPMARQVVAKQWSSRTLERAIKKEEKEGVTTKKGKSVDLERLERSLSEYFGTEVKIENSAKNKGNIRIHYNSLDEFEGVLERVGWRDE